MKTYQYNIGGQAISISLTHDGRIAELLADGTQPQPAANDMARYAAVIALALFSHDAEVVHDDEVGRITIQQHESPWASPAELMERI